MLRPGQTLGFSEPFEGGTSLPAPSELLKRVITRDWALGEGRGAGVKVAIIDSGVDQTHPAVGPIQGYADIREDAHGLHVSTEPHEDLFGHGTACAGIIRRLAPEAEIYSVRVLGGGLFCSGRTLLRGIVWALENGCHICNLSLGTTKMSFFAALHKVVDLAYFRRVVLVVAANNAPRPSFPGDFAGVVSVASHEIDDPELLLYNRNPPAEFGAHGINVRVPWLNGGYVVSTGNSYASPHVVGLIAKMLSVHPQLTPTEVKAILKTISHNTVDVLGSQLRDWATFDDYSYPA